MSMPPPTGLQQRAAVMVDRLLSESIDDKAALRALIGVAAGRLAHLDEAGALRVLRNVAVAVEMTREAVH